MKTPQQSYPELAAVFGIHELYFKREDLHPYGSHKGRSIPHMVKTYAREGCRDFVISSSGNAALAAIHTIEQHNKNNPGKHMTLKVFIGHQINKEKKERLQRAANNSQEYVTIQESPNPKQEAFQIDKAGTVKLLRQSTDDLALEGYGQLADELEKIQNLEAVFIPTSSGTTAEALGKAFTQKGKNIQIHIVQTTACRPIAEYFDQSQKEKTDSSIASAIVDRVAHRKQAVIDIVEKTHGNGWIATDEEIATTIKLVKETTKIDLSPNSALSVAGLKKAAVNGWKWNGAVCCLITGR